MVVADGAAGTEDDERWIAPRRRRRETWPVRIE